MRQRLPSHLLVSVSHVVKTDNINRIIRIVSISDRIISRPISMGYAVIPDRSTPPSAAPQSPGWDRLTDYVNVIKGNRITSTEHFGGVLRRVIGG